ncbi:uncharacterized protein Z518_07082 [Rhinocladiella mackenziei CBS 650.93]|uniref:Uncharacterized protein n=1 Tax=Rhinocladiella mackenziei CBS 650.93 TaxID=1442369 RepID=A0A0D2ICI2_9EURO|nr:uncharacterized protein Z518_07082 [Rhinocladiella mackenziei CBS 650.93]KIX03529.1 hypothetical protein Z518_07082 [Rhinocladiella mackenziei CBS 650.93]
MNNPALPPYASQSPGPYAFTSPQPGAHFSISAGPPFDAAQAPFQPGMISNHMQRPSHPQQTQQPIPQHLYQQHPGQVGAFSRPENRSNFGPPNKGSSQHPNLSCDPARVLWRYTRANPPAGTPSDGRPHIPVTQGTNQTFHPHQTQISASAPPPLPASSAPTEGNMAANIGLQGQQPNASLAQQAQIQNAAQMARPAPQQQQQGGPQLSPQSAARERARVSVLLEINAHLLQEVVSLQAQGKAGPPPNQGQQSPTSPTSATDPSNALNNSPGEPAKSATGTGTTPSKPPSQEYADCMRRLQANLSYLAAIADAKKKVTGALPTGPAILVPPPHLPQVHDLYKKLNALFPEAGQSAINKAMAHAAQSQNQNTSAKTQRPVSVPAQG